MCSRGQLVMTIAVVLMLLSGCGGAAPTATPVATPTVIPPSPTPTIVPTPTPFPVNQVTFQTEDGVQIAATLYGAGEIAVILAHQGTPGADQTTWQPFATTLAENGFTAMTFDFRGVGQSGGTLDHALLDKDVRAAVQYLHDQQYRQIVCAGASMGGTACLRVAIDDKPFIGLIILASTMIAGLNNNLKISAEEMSVLTQPKLFITAEKDSSLVVHDTKRMYNLSPEPKELLLLEEHRHGTRLFRTEVGEKLSGAMLDFLKALPSATATLPPTRTPAPTASPASGEHIAFVSDRDGNGEIYVTNVDGSDQRRLTNWRLWDGFPDWSPDGSQIVYYSYVSSQNWVIKIMDLDGGAVRQVTNSGVCDGAPHWSPDGAWITYDSGDCTGDHRDVYIVAADGGTPHNLTNHEADDMLAAWSPDSTQLVFSSNRDGNYELYVMNVDGSNVRRLTDDPAEDHAPAWSPDGTQIAFYSDRDGNEEIYVMDADGSNPRNLTHHPAADWFPRWSPDGSQITFSSQRTGHLDIYVMNADGSEVRQLTDNRYEDFNSVWQPTPRSDTWIRSYQDGLLGTALNGVATDDGGYLFVGSTHYTHDNRDDEDLYLLKTDADGEPEWEKTIGGDRFDRGNRIIPALDGGFLILGETRSLGAGDRDMYLLKVNAQGEELWSQVYGGPKEEMAFTIRPTTDGSYILTGQTASFGAGGTDIYVVKTDSQGNAEWSQTYGSEQDEEGYAAVGVPGGGFLVLGVLLHPGQDYVAMNPDIYLVWTDAAGNLINSKVLEEPGAQGGHVLLPTSDGNYLISGIRSTSNNASQIDPLLLKINTNGEVLWDQAIGEANVMDYCATALATADGGYLLAGMGSHSSRGTIPLIKVDSDGQVLWRQTLAEGPGNWTATAILKAPGDHYLLVGTVSSGQGWYTVLIKTDAEGRMEQ